jgi:hypothetical protein
MRGNLEASEYKHVALGLVFLRAAIRAKIGRLLNVFGYPPDGQERAVQLAIEQAELLARAA